MASTGLYLFPIHFQYHLAFRSTLGRGFDLYDGLFIRCDAIDEVFNILQLNPRYVGTLFDDA